MAELEFCHNLRMIIKKLPTIQPLEILIPNGTPQRNPSTTGQYNPIGFAKASIIHKEKIRRWQIIRSSLHRYTHTHTPIHMSFKLNQHESYDTSCLWTKQRYSETFQITYFHRSCFMILSPPWIFAGSEIGFNPWNKHDLPIINITMSQRQRLFQQKEGKEASFYHM